VELGIAAAAGDMDEESRRESERHAISMEVTIETPETTVSATATNISLHGIGIQSLKSIPPGTQATITMKVPEEVILYVKLLWSRHTLIQNLDAYQMGFEIYGLAHRGSIYDEPSKREEIIQAILSGNR